MSEGDEDNLTRGRSDSSLHTIAIISLGLWAARILGVAWALGLVLGVVAAILAGNMIITAKFGDLRVVRLNRWAWPVCAFIFLLMHSARLENVAG